MVGSALEISGPGRPARTMETRIHPIYDRAVSGEAEQPWDLYREIHKAMRFALFGVTTRAGSTDPTDDAALLAEWRDVAMVLPGHHAHEDQFCDPLVLRHAPDLREELEGAHRGTDEALDHLDRDAAALASTSSGDRGSLVQRFHLDLADFTAAYLTHLRFEEDRVMPALNAAMSGQELAEVTGAIRGSVPPPDKCVFIRYMVPAMSFPERLDMLGGM